MSDFVFAPFTVLSANATYLFLYLCPFISCHTLSIIYRNPKLRWRVLAPVIFGAGPLD